MPNFLYKAKSLQGEAHSGIIEAKNKQMLARNLRKQGYILISAETSEQKKGKTLSFSIPGFGVKLSDKIFFARNLQIMVSSGVSLPQALNTLSELVKNKKFSNSLLEIKREIIRGKNFSTALSDYPEIFSELFCNMIRVGEEAGTLDQSLKILTKQMEKNYELKNKIKSAMIYPAVIVSAMLGVGILMLVIVVPKLAETFDELGIELPLTTQLVIFLGTFLTEKWYLALLIILVFAFLLFTILKTKKGGKFFDKILLKIPIISSLVKKTNSAYTVRTLGSLIASGVPITRSLNITSNSVGNFYYKKALKHIAEKVQKGSKISEAIYSYKDIYPAIVVQMLKVGEETGETSEILTKLADFFEKEVTRAAENMSAVIEPVLMLIVGAAVGFFAVSMIQPMYSMLEGI